MSSQSAGTAEVEIITLDCFVVEATSEEVKIGVPEAVGSVPVRISTLKVAEVPPIIKYVAFNATQG